MVMAIQMRRLPPEQVNKTLILCGQFLRNFIQRQSVFLRHLPDPFPQYPVTSKARHCRQRPAQRQNKVHSDGKFRYVATQLYRMVNCRTVNQRRCRGDNTIATSFNNAVVLSFTQAKIIRIYNQYAFHSRPQLVLFAFEFLNAPGKVWQPFFMCQN